MKEKAYKTEVPVFIVKIKLLYKIAIKVSEYLQFILILRWMGNSSQAGTSPQTPL